MGKQLLDHGHSLAEVAHSLQLQPLRFTQPTSAPTLLPASLPPLLGKAEGFVQPPTAPQKSIHLLSGLSLQKDEKHPCRTSSSRPGRSCSCFMEPEMSWSGSRAVLAGQKGWIAAGLPLPLHSPAQSRGSHCSECGDAGLGHPFIPSSLLSPQAWEPCLVLHTSRTVQNAG